MWCCLNVSMSHCARFTTAYSFPTNILEKSMFETCIGYNITFNNWVNKTLEFLPVRSEYGVRGSSNESLKMLKKRLFDLFRRMLVLSFILRRQTYLPRYVYSSSAVVCRVTKLCFHIYIFGLICSLEPAMNSWEVCALVFPHWSPLDLPRITKIGSLIRHMLNWVMCQMWRFSVYFVCCLTAMRRGRGSRLRCMQVCCMSLRWHV